MTRDRAECAMRLKDYKFAKEQFKLATGLLARIIRAVPNQQSTPPGNSM
jgi:hypothetical protein